MQTSGLYSCIGASGDMGEALVFERIPKYLLIMYSCNKCLYFHQPRNSVLGVARPNVILSLELASQDLHLIHSYHVPLFFHTQQTKQACIVFIIFCMPNPSAINFWFYLVVISVLDVFYFDDTIHIFQYIDFSAVLLRLGYFRILLSTFA